jgi:hypothetical protein
VNRFGLALLGRQTEGTNMLRLFGIRPNRLLIALAGIGVLAIGLAKHGPELMVVGGLLIAWAAVTLVASRWRRDQ